MANRFFLSAVMAAFLVPSAEAWPLIIGFIDRPAYSWQEDGQPMGLQVEIARDILTRAVSQTQMVGMLAMNRFDYMFADQEEYQALARANGLDPSGFRLMVFPDIPEGNKRRLMCSKAVTAATIDRINAAIGP